MELSSGDPGSKRFMGFLKGVSKIGGEKSGLNCMSTVWIEE